MVVRRNRPFVDGIDNVSLREGSWVQYEAEDSSSFSLGIAVICFIPSMTGCGKTWRYFINICEKWLYHNVFCAAG
jgi:hypothetical protein